MSQRHAFPLTDAGADPNDELESKLGPLPTADGSDWRHQELSRIAKSRARLYGEEARRSVMHRDGGRCVVPGCRDAVFVDVHHLVLRSEGGEHSADQIRVPFRRPECHANGPTGEIQRKVRRGRLGGQRCVGAHPPSARGSRDAQRQALAPPPPTRKPDGSSPRRRTADSHRCSRGTSKTRSW